MLPQEPSITKADVRDILAGIPKQEIEETFSPDFYRQFDEIFDFPNRYVTA